MRSVKECVIERYLVDQVERKLKGEARKWTTRTHDPDRILLLPGGKTVFVEVKRPGAKPRDGQLREIARLNKMGFPAYWVSTKAEVDLLIEELRNAPRKEEKPPTQSQGTQTLGV